MKTKLLTFSWPSITMVTLDGSLMQQRDQMAKEANDIEDRIADLATYEKIEVLWNAFYGALEADLSSAGWPGQSHAAFDAGVIYIEKAMSEGKNG
jgi:hypothetical protein